MSPRSATTGAERVRPERARQRRSRQCAERRTPRRRRAPRRGAPSYLARRTTARDDDEARVEASRGDPAARGEPEPDRFGSSIDCRRRPARPESTRNRPLPQTRRRPRGTRSLNSPTRAPTACLRERTGASVPLRRDWSTATFLHQPGPRRERSVEGWSHRSLRRSTGRDDRRLTTIERRQCAFRLAEALAISSSRRPRDDETIRRDAAVERAVRDAVHVHDVLARAHPELVQVEVRVSADERIERPIDDVTPSSRTTFRCSSLRRRPTPMFRASGRTASMSDQWTMRPRSTP